MTTHSPSPLDRLRRSDKLSLGGGRLCLWAPEFPRWADRPGFWDHAAYLEHAVEPLYTLTVLDEQGLEVPLTLAARGWSPARLSQLYRGHAGASTPAGPAAFPAPPTAAIANLRVQEDKALSPEDVFLAHLAITNLLPRRQPLTVVLWTAQPRGTAQAGTWLALHPAAQAGGPAAWVFTRHLPGGGVKADHAVALALGADRAPASFSAAHSEWSTGRANHPRWELTPFYESARLVGEHVFLNDQQHVEGGPRGNADDTLLYLAYAYPLELGEAETAALTFGCALAPEAPEALAALRAALPPEPEPALAAAHPGNGGHAQAASPALARVEQGWHDYFAGLPTFTCSDPFIEKYFYYRYFGLRLNTVDTGGRFNLAGPAVYEGINTGWFRHPISYSAQAHLREARWLAGPRLAQASLGNFVRQQRPDGSLPGVIHTGSGAEIAGDFIYHADWGASLLALHAVHPDDAFLRQVFQPLVRYAIYYQREHDPAGTHLYDIRNQAETGQEYMPRYLAADPLADRWGPFRLKGLDPTIYAYNLCRCLEWLAERLGEPLPPALRGEASAIAGAVREHMWDAELGFFFDVVPDAHGRPARRVTSLAAVGFYPFLTDIPGPEHLRAFDYLFDPDVFWTPCPVPATAASDPAFSAEGEWKGRRHVCPWNGRAWPMTTSHVAQALAQTAQRTGNPALAERAAELIRRYVHGFYLGGDLARPTSYEYYNPLTGAAPYFRGTDDYMHSWVADLIVQFVAGLQPQPDGRLVVQPLPFGLDAFALERAYVAGHRVDVRYRAEDGLRAWLDGREVAHQAGLERIELALPG